MQRRYFASMATAAVALAVLAWPQPARADNKGELAFNNNCRTCHSVKAGDNRLGPSLHKVVGRKAASGGNFGYSQALANSGIVWDEATLDKFITNPDSVVPNNNMKPFTGIADPAVRKQIIEFLKEPGKG
jgi:cytochrome c